ncbi:hypothetical protein PCANB_000707 [Pneumocystis canis]|nr:hypothetical protein PCANB_000707 [Pneumocystis canis]
MRIKQLCFQLLRECDEIRVFVNLLFPNVMESTALKALEDILLELSQAQTTCINIRTSILRYTLSRMKVMRKGMIDSDELQWALQEIDEEALFFIFQYFLQLRNIYIVLYTLLDKNQIILDDSTTSLNEKSNEEYSIITLNVSSPFEPGSGTTISSISCPSSPKLLDSLIQDIPNTPITPFTNRGSDNITENASPLELSSISYLDSAISLYSSDNNIKETTLHCDLTTAEIDQNTSKSPLLVKSMVLSHETTFTSKKVNESSENRGRPAACLFVASLSSSRTDEQLCASVTNHFRKWGNLLNVKVLKDWMQRPYSFVQFENFDDAKRALREAHNTVIDGRHIRVEKARVNRTLYISRIGQPLEEQVLFPFPLLYHSSHMLKDVKNLLEPYGEIEDIVIPSSSNHMFRNNIGKCCFVRFAFRDDAIQAFSNLRRNGNWIVEWAQNLDQNSSQTPMIPIDKTSIFVGQLNPSLVTQESLLNRFKKYGEIVDCSLVNKPNSNRTAFAFLQFESAASASAAVENENNSNFLNRIIRVQFRELHDKVDFSVYDTRSLPPINPQTQFGCKFPLAMPYIPRLRSKSNDSSSLTNRGSLYTQDNTANMQGYYPGVISPPFPMRSQEAFIAAYRAALAATTPLTQSAAINPQNGYSGNIQVSYPGPPVGLTNHINSNSISGYNNQHPMINVHQNPNIMPAPFYYFAGGMNAPYQNMSSNSSLNQDALSLQQDRSKGNNVSQPFLSHWGTLVPTFIHGPGASSMQASLSGHSLPQHQDSLNRIYHFPEGIANGVMHPAWDPSYGYYRFDNQCSPEISSYPLQMPTLQENSGSNFPMYGEVLGHNVDQDVHAPYPLNQYVVNGGITT